MMKLYMYISDLGPGGAERVCVTLANELAARSHEVHIVILNTEQDVYSHTLDSRIQVHSLDVPRIRYAILPIIKLLRKEKAERILVFGDQMGIILSKCRRMGLIKCKIAVRVLNNTEAAVSKEENGSSFVRKMIKRTQNELHKVDVVITQCHAMEEMLQKQMHLGDICHCIYNPVSKYLVENTTPVSRKPGEERRIGFVGRLDPQKNIGDLLQAFSILCKSEEKVTLHLYGQGNQLEYAQNETKKMGIEDKIIFEGVHKDMEAVYGNLDMLVLSSLYEGMPNALIEAVSIGIPVVSYDCPIGPAEIIEDDVNGYLVPMLDVNALAEAMGTCLHKQWEIEEIKKSAQKFRVEDIAAEYERILLEV